jgi:hypothetical protein
MNTDFRFFLVHAVVAVPAHNDDEPDAAISLTALDILDFTEACVVLAAEESELFLTQEEPTEKRRKRNA